MAIEPIYFLNHYEELKAKLKVLEHQKQEMLDNSPDGMMVIDEKGFIVEWNKSMETMTGYPREQVTGKAAWEIKNNLMPDRDRDSQYKEKIRKTLLNGLATGQAPWMRRLIETEIIDKNGNRVYIQETVFPIRTEKGLSICSTVRDVTRIKKVEMELELSEKRFIDTFEISPNMLFITDMETHDFIRVNCSCERFSGYLELEVIGKRPSHLNIWVDGKELTGILDVFNGGGELCDHRLSLLNKKGEVNYVQLTTQIIKFNGKLCRMGLIRDITDRERLKKELAAKENERRMRDILTSLPDATFAIDREGKVIAWNKAMEKLSGINAGDILGRGNYEYSLLFYGERRPTLIDLVMRAEDESVEGYHNLKKDGDSLEAEVYADKDGAGIRYIWCKAGLLYDAEGAVIGSIETIRDITEQKLIEKKLKESERKYSALIQSASDAILVVDAQTGTIIDANQRASELFGIPVGQLIGMNQNQTIPSGMVSEESRFGRVFDLNMERGYYKEYESFILHQRGYEIPVEVSGSVIELFSKKIVMFSLRDITSRIELDKARLQREVLLATEETRKRMERLKHVTTQSIGLDNIHFFSPKMREMYQQALKYHKNRYIPILIQGETGTGKDILAKVIHYGDLEEISSFIDVNCAAINQGIFESELFGYEAGSFTGGLSKGQKGKFDLASGGTLFLDEITEIPLDMQAKLLRAIEERSFYRVGGLKKIKLDARIICATNKNIEKMVKEGYFRNDLYYRLKVGFMHIPPLRRRKEDILQLAEAFLISAALGKGKRFTGISKEAAAIILEYDWPGNVRELKNAIEWVTLMYDETELKPSHLEILHSSSPENQMEGLEIKSDETLEEYTNRYILAKLKRNNGNIQKTAKELGVSRSVIYARIKGRI